MNYLKLVTHFIFISSSFHFYFYSHSHFHFLSIFIFFPFSFSFPFSCLYLSISNVLGKPVAYIMSNYDYQKNLRFSGSNEGYCFVRLTSIGGINRSNNSSLADKITKILSNHLGVKPRRVYIEFRDCSAQNFAFSGSLFG
ncbi:hypothetical protein [Plasmodium yoelii yoelii]|uniref:L-dopachrome isomerase n=1 Tax=Plasmodium yoelii yoelii TaxID=73239 RepID=Q7RDH0_PLAYO|nr:hypothetical protein [Plasmodium yoelii yoelii]